MRKHSAFELQVLGWIADDFEAPHTITSDIARDLKRSVSEAEVRAALLALAQSGLVQAYLYEPAGRRYKPIPYREAEAAEDVWFMATEAGIAHWKRSAS